VIDPNDKTYHLVNLVKIDLNTLRIIIARLQKDGFTEIGLADLLWHVKSAQVKSGEN
jgi:hypothetical protein